MKNFGMVTSKIALGQAANRHQTTRL